MKFGLITYILHHKDKGEYYSYEPYIREMNIWLKFTTDFILLAPKTDKLPDPIESNYIKSPSHLYEIPQTSLNSIKNSFRFIIYLPHIFINLWKIMKRVDHIHLRCPGNIGLLGCMVQILFPHKPKTAKYAGNWDPQANQPWSYKLQRWILSNTFLTRNMTVLVYGDWPVQSKNILPFFTASFSENEIVKIEKDFSAPYKFLFVGNLDPGKQPQLAVELVKALSERNISAELHVYGDGEMLEEIKRQGANKFYIHLYGNQPLEVVKKAYKDSHFLILPSKSEGWPKAVAEAMFFGCIPIVAPISCVPWMLGGGSRGILAPPGPEGGAYTQAWVEEIVNEVQKLIKHPEKMKRMSLEAQEWSQDYTLEKFEKEIKKLLVPKDARP